MEKNSTLGTEPVKRLFIRLVIPSIVAQMISLIYNMVDRIYIGHIAGVGNLALTGVGVCTPVVMLIAAFANLAGIGGANRSSIALGKGDHERAQRILGTSFVFSIILSIVLTIVFRGFSSRLLLLFGASENTLPFALAYMNTYSVGIISILLSLSMNFFITAQGFTKISMMSVSLGAVCNIILDPIFIFGLKMGIQGAALATVISQTVSMIWILSFLCGKKAIVRIQRKYARLNFKILGSCVALGISPFVMSSTECILSMCFNQSLLRYGGDIAVGTMAIFNTINQITYLPMHGISLGAQPITSYNYGANRWDRVRENIRIHFTASIIFETIMWILVMFVPKMFIHIFTNDAELVAYAERMIRIFFACLFMMSLQNTCQNNFLAMGNAKTSLFLALERKIFLLIPLIFILPHIWTANQASAVFLAEPIADFAAASTTISMFLHQYGKKLFVKKSENRGNIE